MLGGIFVVEIFIDNVFKCGVKSEWERKEGWEVKESVGKVGEEVRGEVVGDKKGDVEEENGRKEKYGRRGVVYGMVGICVDMCR